MNEHEINLQEKLNQIKLNEKKFYIKKCFMKKSIKKFPVQSQVNKTRYRLCYRKLFFDFK